MKEKDENKDNVNFRTEGSYIDKIFLESFP